MRSPHFSFFAHPHKPESAQSALSALTRAITTRSTREAGFVCERQDRARTDGIEAILRRPKTTVKAIRFASGQAVAWHRRHAATRRSSPNAAHHAAAFPAPAVSARTTSAMTASDLQTPGALSPPAAALSPHAATPKTVAFELLFNETPYRARLPLRVSIFPHDTTDSIVTTVKNFYGLYSGPTVSKGVSFEDELGNTLIARYENFGNNMVVYVRVIEENSFAAYPPAQMPPQSYYHADPYPVQAAQVYGQHMSRPVSRTSPRRSPSPNSRGRRSASASTNPTVGKKGRSRSSKTRGPASYTNGDGHSDSLNGYSSGDGDMGSVSGRSREHIGNTEISVENIVEGGRRKRAKFESSELPLFAPPQMPAATSNASVSPARRPEHHRHSLPFVQPSQNNPFTHPRPLQSPQGHAHGYGHAGMYATPAPADRRTRASISYVSGAATVPAMTMMPTPDPTVGSCMSEEDKDVAIQLMRLGEMSNMSHGRTSASTMDDTFSGRADAASSTGATSDAESESDDDDDDDNAPAARRQRLDASGHHKKVMPTTESHFVAAATPHESVEGASGDDADLDDAPPPPQGSMAAPKLKNAKSKLPAKPRAPKTKSASTGGTKSAKSSSASKGKKAAAQTTMPGPMSPASLSGGAPRKPAHANVQAAAMAHGQAADGAAGGEDQPDLSTKPRCQRCRKSKKGCDRQRPCGRCRDAGLPAEMCVSEDEGNGRKGRYGRHMGVPVVTGAGAAAAAVLGGPKDGADGARAGMPPPLPPPPPPATLLPAAPIAAGLGASASTGGFAALGPAAHAHAQAAALAMPAPPVGMGLGGAMGMVGDKGKKRKSECLYTVYPGAAYLLGLWLLRCSLRFIRNPS
ncbi:hypothetical protein P8C59_008317 [Phyllachora maydis]|uniref:Zn(2)-C6 fungal-type domain-containing protein n=1 Tax=Phyllachora maydis TaxID=1825666 RepID=A0AAD9IB78_9PEZI|nr:hypothetical protein P8C59_008317 [Phyllachora maydis]